MAERIPIARAIVYNGDEILVLQNSEADPVEEAREKWEMPGGVVESHDDHERETVKREIKEETGLEVDIEEKLERIAVEEDGRIADCQYYLARADSREVVLSEEHQGYRWIAPEDFRDMDWLNYAGYTIPVLQKVGKRLG